MKLASVSIDGRRTYGAVRDDSFIELAPLLLGCASLDALLGDKHRLAQARDILGSAPAIPCSRVHWLPPVEGRLFALGWAYADHQAETNKEPPTHPFLFLRTPQSVVGHDEAIVRPAVSSHFDFEGEIALVIGRPGRNIPLEQAAHHIAGYSLVMDGSIRDWQLHSVTAGKNFDASGSFGPWIVTADEVPAAADIALVTRLNGQEMQRTTFDNMAWPVAMLVHYLSTITALRPGDIISTGTPAGVGNKRRPQVFMQAGDTLEVEATGIGCLRNRVVDQHPGEA